MPVLLRNVLAIPAGFLLGSVVNMAIIQLGSALIPLPHGLDPTQPESLAAAIHLLQPQHFLAPFLAHALGTLCGAAVAWLIAATHKTKFACAIGLLFLCGGIAACFMIPAPAWFMAVDLLLAYLPMTALGVLLARRIQHRTQRASRNL